MSEQNAGQEQVNEARGAEANVRIRLDISYDGSDFNGWSKQPGQRTVQGEIEAAFATIFRRYGPPPTLVVAGRTDAGVHAAGQVAHADLTVAQAKSLLRPRGHSFIPKDAGEALARRVNGIFGSVPDIVIAKGSLAPFDFNARFSALWRRYRYRVADQLSIRDPLQRHRTSWHSSPLDIEAMDRASNGLVGLHDFAAFCKPRPGATTIRTLHEFRWWRDEDGVLVGELEADAFCHSMVRALVGACVAVGEGKLEERDLALTLHTGAREDLFKTMPARGLTLIQVGYPEDSELAARAALTRARRELPEGREPAAFDQAFDRGAGVA